MNKTTRRVLSFVLSFLLVFSLWTPTITKAAEVETQSSNEVEIAVGDSATLKVSGLRHNTTWESSDTDVATVSNKGVVTGIAPGTASVTATYEDYRSKEDVIKEFIVTVVEKEDTIKLKVGETITLPAPGSGGKTTWKSSNKKIAKVSRKEGTVTGISEGTVTITATNKDGGRDFWFFSWGGKITTRKYNVEVTNDGETPEPQPETYTVTFQTNGGSAVEPQTVEKGQTAKKPTDPTKDGFTFAGWYSDEELTTEYDFGSPVKHNITVYAKWDEDSRNVYKVIFDLRIDGIVKNTEIYEPQNIVENMTVSKPADPEPIIGEFLGWYTSEDCTVEFDFDLPIMEETVIYANWYFDETDTDNDGLPDIVEKQLGLDLTKEDTDGDGLPDYVELVIGTDPLLVDTDGNGINDYDEDADLDELINGFEVANGTDPINMDSDFDGLSDGDEINEYGTDPKKEDTDGDGATDGWEILNGFDALTFNQTFEITIDSEPVSEVNPVSASVNVIANGDVVDSLEVQHASVVNNPLLSSTMAGYLGSAYEFSIDGDFDSAVLTFEYDTSLGIIGDDFQPRIYYFNEEEGTFEEVENQKITDGKAIAEVAHFSTYVLLNKIKVDQVWATEIKTTDDSSQMTGIDVVFVIDSSGSMSSNDSNGIRKSAAKEFVDKLGENDRAAVIDFDSTASLYQEFTSDHELLYSAIDRVDSSGGTSLSVGMNLAITQFTADSYSRTDAYKYIIFLTDGDGSYDTSYTSKAADNSIVVYTIGLGSGVKTSTLTAIAEGTGGKYYFASTASELPDIYEDVSFETVDYITDSNNDGISDYYTKLICEGTLLLSNGSNEFKYIDFNYNANGELSDDYDGDGLKNGEELEVVNKGNKVYMLMHSDPMLVHSDMDGIDDYTEVQNGSNPKKIQYNSKAIEEITNDDGYYYEYYVNNIYDDSILYQIDSAFLSVIFGVWNQEELFRDILADYMVDYAPVENNEDKKIGSVITENIDRIIGTITQNGSELADKADSFRTFFGDAKNLIDVINGSVTSIDTIMIQFKTWVETVYVYDAQIDTIIISGQKMSQLNIDVIISNSPLKISDLDKISAGVAVAIGAADIIDTITSAIKVRTNAEYLEHNLDFLRDLRDNGKRNYIKKAANDVINLIGEGYGNAIVEAIKEIGSDTLEMAANVAIVIASKNPYVSAVIFVRDTIDKITGISDTLKTEYEILAYDCMSYGANRMFTKASYKSGSYYYQNNDSFIRHLTNLAQIRILGEKKYEMYYTTGMNSWFNDEEDTKKAVEKSIDRVKNNSSMLGLKLASNIDK